MDFHLDTLVNLPNIITEPLLWVNKRQRQTKRYQEHIYERIKELTVKQVSENEKMSKDAVRDIFHIVTCSELEPLNSFAQRPQRGIYYPIPYPLLPLLTSDFRRRSIDVAMSESSKN